MPEIHRSEHRSQGSQTELFLLLGQVLENYVLLKEKAPNSYGLLIDEATDVEVIEPLISFMQFSNPESGALEVYFLPIQIVL